ncbi:MAG: DUF1285 domain-containing protein [Pseudomonadota bacterium]|nr:DUF1285 domain-containing protein [Pseudomonadota bacterium]
MIYSDNNLSNSLKTILKVSEKSSEKKAFCGHFNIRIDRNGQWYYQESPIRRKSLIKHFSSLLHRERDGTYWLKTPYETGRIQVEDVPFIALEMKQSGTGKSQKVDFRTNIDEIIPIGPIHSIWVENKPETEEQLPYINVGKFLDARISRSAFYHLVDICEEEYFNHKKCLGVWSRNRFFYIGDI